MDLDKRKRRASKFEDVSKEELESQSWVSMSSREERGRFVVAVEKRTLEMNRARRSGEKNIATPTLGLDMSWGGLQPGAIHGPSR
jgi:hypothetical protein